MTVMDVNDLLTFLEKAPGIQKLNLGGLPEDKSLNVVLKVAQLLPKLQKLSLEDYFPYTNEIWFFKNSKLIGCTFDGSYESTIVSLQSAAKAIFANHYSGLYKSQSISDVFGESDIEIKWVD